VTFSLNHSFFSKRVINYSFVLGAWVVFLLQMTTACVRLEKPSPEIPSSVQTSKKSAASPKPWLLVDTKKDSLTVMQGGEILEQFDNIAFGVSGVGIKRQRGDGITPVGVFRVGWFNPQSRFSYFIGLNYPNLTYVTQAYKEKRIDKATYEQARQALLAGYLPPQDTLLGGQIGIHGVGLGDLDVHRNFNWTNGCVALDNEQIQRLVPWVEKGTRVVIR
jgi:murein L,D-transpeptidase YafK